MICRYKGIYEEQLDSGQDSCSRSMCPESIDQSSWGLPARDHVLFKIEITVSRSKYSS